MSMRKSTVTVRRWTGPPPDEETLRQIYANDGLRPHGWSNGPHDVYAVHHHPYEKVLRVVRGTIRFDLPQQGESIELRAGDELILPANVAHGAVVGPDGVVCLEAHRSAD